MIIHDKIQMQQLPFTFNIKSVSPYKRVITFKIGFPDVNI